MKQFILIQLFISASLIFSQNSILQDIDSSLSFTESDISGRFSFVREFPGSENKDIQVAQIYRRDAENKFTVVILEPSEKRGKGYLQVNNNMWVYDPVSGRFNVTSARDRFQDYPFRTSDFSRSTLARDYNIESIQETRISGMEIKILELTATSDSVPFARKKIWVNDKNLIIKQIDYSYSGQNLRTILIPRYKKLGDRYIATNMIIIDALKFRDINGKKEYEKTTITVENASIADVPDMYYTQAFLERIGN